MDDLSPLHQIASAQAQGNAQLFKPREAFRARLAGGRGGGGGRGGAGPGADPSTPQFPQYGANINYQLARGGERVSIEVQDSTGKVIRSFSSEAAAAPVADAPVAAPPDDEEGGGGGRGRGGAPPVRLTTNAGMNRLVWDFNNSVGMMVPPGSYKVKMTAGSYSETQPLALRLDPRLVENGISAAALKEQYEHNMRMREMVTEVGRVANRVRQARTRLRAANSADSLAKVEALAVTLFGPDEGVRYGRPGLQTQITYLAGMTGRVDQRVGRDALDRMVVLRKELSDLEARVNQVLGPERPLVP
jgi:hypothetical protein